jgi:DNA methylase
VNAKTVENLIGPDAASKLSTTEKLELLDANGFIVWPKAKSKHADSFPRFKRFLSEGGKVQDIILDIPPINSQAQERLGYPTQKPAALLQRIIRCSSNKGDVVLDPFCGCGTATSVAQSESRQWRGIDITQAAIVVIKQRLWDDHSLQAKKDYAVIGEPTSLPDAEALANDEPYQFQWWALGLVGARPIEKKKGADKGIDGRLYFHDDPMDTRESKQIIFSVKGGQLKPDDIRALGHVVTREHAQLGVLLTLQKPTKPMRIDAASGGFYTAPWGKTYQRLRIITVEDLLNGETLEIPRENVTFKKSVKIAGPTQESGNLFGPSA